MKMTEEGMALIKRFEGLRLQTYHDAAGVLTIGYGHTSMAGEPVVRTGLQISEADADDILRRDVQQFASGVAGAVKIPLTDQQFSALVSFAYNVGLGAFRKSGVLAAVNTGDFDTVPRRLQVWAKAGGRVLPGLVRRRAAEAALFVSENGSSTTTPVVPIPAKPMSQSRTLWSAATVMLLAVVQAWLSLSLKMAGLAVLVAMAAGLGLIVYERYKKMKMEGV